MIGKREAMDSLCHSQFPRKCLDLQHRVDLVHRRSMDCEQAPAGRFARESSWCLRKLRGTAYGDLHWGPN